MTNDRSKATTNRRRIGRSAALGMPPTLALAHRPPVAAYGLRSRPLRNANPAALTPLPINDTRGPVGGPRTSTTGQKEGARNMLEKSGGEP